jgi:hypothetical protein
MSDNEMQMRILAQAVLEVRVLLSEYLGDAGADVSVRTAAHLAYALHEDASAILAGRSFDPVEAVSSLDAIDRMFDESLVSRFSRSLAG